MNSSLPVTPREHKACTREQYIKTNCIQYYTIICFGLAHLRPLVIWKTIALIICNKAWNCFGIVIHVTTPPLKSSPRHISAFKKLNDPFFSSRTREKNQNYWKYVSRMKRLFTKNQMKWLSQRACEKQLHEKMLATGLRKKERVKCTYAQREIKRVQGGSATHKPGLVIIHK